MNRHHRPDDIRQDRGRHGARSEVRARPAGGTHRTTDNQLTALDEATGLLNASCNLLVHRENTIDRQMIGTRAYERRIRSGTEQQLETRQHHRLTRTGLTGDDDKALAKVDVADSMTPRCEISRESITEDHPPPAHGKIKLADETCRKWRVVHAYKLNGRRTDARPHHCASRDCHTT